MKRVKNIILFLLLAGLLAACSNSSASCDNCTVENYTVLPKAGKTIIVDVRTTEEWNNDGHADCTVNYPLDELNTKTETLKTFEKVVVVCRSGNRAGAAKEMLEQSGIKNVENKGAWQNIKCKYIIDLNKEDGKVKNTHTYRFFCTSGVCLSDGKKNRRENPC